MKVVEINFLKKWYSSNRQEKVSGRWITLQQIIPLIENLNSNFKIRKIGKSFLKKDIYSVSIGKGKIKILIWTQMHGNESTGTKALFDLFNLFENPQELSYINNQILNQCTIVCVPMLNPDGAEVYTRLNAQKIDLNRDVIDKKAVETDVLQGVLNEVKPDFCFNMHDQRTIFSVGKENKPATISFLAPSEDIDRLITKGRKQTMYVINAMFEFMKKFIPNQIGRYTDEFYPTATGDNFQKMGHNTILIESGHYFNDYEREKSREYTFYALFQGIYFIASKQDMSNYKDYFNIPNNEKYYLDIIIKNVNYKDKKVDIGIVFKEKLINNELKFIPTIDKIENLSNYSTNKLVLDSDLVFFNKKDMKDWVKNEFN